MLEKPWFATSKRAANFDSRAAVRSWTGYGLAVAAVGLASIARFLLDPYLGNHLPYPTFFVAVALVTWRGSVGASLFAVALGALASDWLFIPPRQSFAIEGVPQQVGMGTYFLVSLVFVAFGHALQRARREAKDAARTFAEEQQRLRVQLGPLAEEASAPLPESAFRHLLSRLTFWPILAALVLVLMLGGLIQYLLHSAQMVDHTNEVLAEISRVEKLGVDMETGIRGYRLTGDRVFLEPFERANAALPAQLDGLQKLLGDNRVQTGAVNQLREGLRLWSESAAAMRQRAENNLPVDRALHVEGKRLMDAVRAHINAMQEREQQLLRERSADLTRVRRFTLAGVLFAGLLVPLFVLVVRRALRRVSASYRGAWTACDREREQFRVTLSSIGDAVIATDTAGNVIFLNAVAASLTGWSAEESRGQPLTTVFKIINEHSRQPVESPVARVLREGTVVGLANHTLLLAKDGRETPIADSAAPIRDVLGETAGVVMVFRDQSEERKAENLLTEQKELLEQIASGRAFDECLEKICRTVARLSPGTRAAIHLTDGEHKKVVRTIAVEVPASLGEAIKGVLIDDQGTNSCSEALYRGEAITSADIEQDERFTQVWRKVCLGHGIRACHFTPLFDDDGKPAGALGLFSGEPRPPTDWELKLAALGAQVAGIAIAREKAESKLRASEAQLGRNHETFFRLVKNTPFGTYIVDSDFRLVEVSAGAEEVFRNIHPLIGRDFARILRDIWEEPFATEAIQRFRHTLATGEPYRAGDTTEQRADTKDVESYDWKIERIALPDGTFGVVCYFYDLTELRQAQEALRQWRDRFDIVRDGAQVGFWFCDLPFDELIWDNRVKEHFWLAPDARVTIATFYERIHPDDRERTRAAIAESMASKTRYDIEYRTASPADGREKWIRAIGQTFYNEQGQPIRFDGVTLDITERKRDEDDLRASRSELAAANEQLASRAAHLDALVQKRTEKLTETIGELEAFSYSITHDLRAPLRALQSFSTILLDDYELKLDDTGQDYLRRIRTSASRMDKLIQDVLHYSRVLRMDLKLEPVSIEKLLNGMLESYPDLQEPKVSITLQHPLPDVLGNEAALTQCFSNLLNNAVKFVKPGVKPQIKIYAENYPAVSGSPYGQPGQNNSRPSVVRYWVEDNGIGLEPKHKERIFGMFQRLSQDYEGTGIGLSIVRKAAERMSGNAGVESEPQKGSRFWIDLKVATHIEAVV